jgi:hypothetical protein
MDGGGHLNAERFDFFATGNYTAVIVTEYGDGFSVQVRSKQTLTTDIKIVAID